MASLLAAWKQREDPESGPSEPTPRKKIPKVAVYVSGATASQVPLLQNLEPDDPSSLSR